MAQDMTESQNIHIVITKAGRKELINAEQNGIAPIVLTEVGLGTGVYTASEDQTELLQEFKRLDTIAGGAAGDSVLHINVSDASDESYTVTEVGVYTETGTLFAVYSQSAPIVQKTELSVMLLVLDMVLTNINPESVEIGDINFLYSHATTARPGIIELATHEEVRAGVDGTRAVTPATLLKSFVHEYGEAGIQELSGGMMVQWGKAQIAPDGSTQIVFPATFPNAAYGAWAISATDVFAAYGVASLTAGNVSFKHNANGGLESYWLAIGR